MPEMAVTTGLVDIDCDDATLADILRQFRKTTGANIISTDSSNLQQRVSVSLRHVPWLDALQAILNTKKFRLEPRGDIYFVSEDKQLEPMFTRTFVLNHASAKELAELFNSTLGGGGRDPKTGKPRGGQIATAFEGANVVVVTAPEKILADCEQIIKSVDKAIPQIYIEARFIEVSNEAMHKLGLQWNQLESWGASVKNLEAGFSYNNGRIANYGTRVSSMTESSNNNTSGSSGTTGGTTSTSSSSLSKTIEVISPTGVGSGTSSSSFNRSDLDMAWRNARGFSGQLSVDDFRLAMSAFEQMDDVKIFSNPKIIVSNGKEARVDMTTKFPNVRVQATRNTSNGSDSLDISTQLEAIPGEDKLMFAKEVFFGWGITLSVKPRISPDGLINVEIVPTISQLDTDLPGERRRLVRLFLLSDHPGQEVDDGLHDEGRRDGRYRRPVEDHRRGCRLRHPLPAEDSVDRSEALRLEEPWQGAEGNHRVRDARHGRSGRSSCGRGAAEKCDCRPRVHRRPQVRAGRPRWRPGRRDVPRHAPDRGKTG